MTFSIITVALNAEKLIVPTIRSVLEQTFQDYEIIVKDGMSKDNTLAMIPSDPRIKVISEKDTGIYNAMNQGIREASGDFLLFLNCGDLLYDKNVLQRVAEQIPVNKSRCILYGNYMHGNDPVIFPPTISKFRFIESTVCHQASFISRDCFELVGFYDETLKISSDWEFFLDARIHNVSYQYLDFMICQFLEGGVSETDANAAIIAAERKKIIDSRFSKREIITHKLLKTKLGQFLLRIRRKIGK